MSAIYGVLRPGGDPAAAAELEGMRRASDRWGGDGGGERLDGPVALGAALRTDAPTSAGERQPLVRGPLCLVADARLDGRAELARVLGVPNAERDSVPDAELVLRAYERWGDRCPERLLGSWAFALWDARAGRLLLAVDHMGQRPLTYARAGRAFVFGTDHEAVLAHPGIERRVDEEAAVARVIRAAHVGLERTPWAGVRKVRPGGALSVAPGGPPREWTYWRPGLRPAAAPAAPEEHAAALRETLALAVSDAVRSVHPVAAHLSGGLDSTTVAVLAARALAADGRALTCGVSWSPAPRGAPKDEQLRVEEVTQALGIGCVWLEPAPEVRRRGLERDARLQPNETRLAEDTLLPAVRARGARVVLSGWGGDELASFNARGHLAWLLRAGRLATLVREATGPARRGGAGPVYVARTLRARIARDAIPPLLPRRLQRERHAVVSNEGIHPLAGALEREHRRRLGVRPSPRATQIALLSDGHITLRLEAWAHAAADAGTAYRFPLLDRRVMDLCLSLPEGLWMRDGWSRWLFRAAASPLLPASIAWGQPKEEAQRQAAAQARREATEEDADPLAHLDGEPLAVELMRRRRDRVRAARR